MGKPRLRDLKQAFKLHYVCHPMLCEVVVQWRPQPDCSHGLRAQVTRLTEVPRLSTTLDVPRSCSLQRRGMDRVEPSDRDTLRVPSRS